MPVSLTLSPTLLLTDAASDRKSGRGEECFARNQSWFRPGFRPGAGFNAISHGSIQVEDTQLNLWSIGARAQRQCFAIESLPQINQLAEWGAAYSFTGGVSAQQMLIAPGRKIWAGTALSFTEFKDSHSFCNESEVVLGAELILLNACHQLTQLATSPDSEITESHIMGAVLNQRNIQCVLAVIARRLNESACSDLPKFWQQLRGWKDEARASLDASADVKHVDPVELVSVASNTRSHFMIRFP